MSDNINILGISGSLRKGSYNTLSLVAAQKLAPKNITITLCDISAIPLYNEDVRDKGVPSSVNDFRDSIKKADAIIIATPEYNYSIPGVLKNAIDWASRPPEQPFEAKPIGIIGASMGMLGTARAQYHLRQCFVFMNAYIMNKPEVMIGGAHTKFDQDGNLTDDKTQEVIKKFLEELVSWTKKFGSK